jgi:hypothetical protein
LPEDAVIQQLTKILKISARVFYEVRTKDSREGLDDNRIETACRALRSVHRRAEVHSYRPRRACSPPPPPTEFGLRRLPSISAISCSTAASGAPLCCHVLHPSDLRWMRRFLPLFRWCAAPDENVGAKVGAVRPYHCTALTANLGR